MAMNFTPAQSAAIELRGRTLLVSAGAGSGKTRVLTERIIRLLTDPEAPADISRMLICTFTRAAAGELRERISSALAAELAKHPEDRRLAAQIVALGSANISTIDSYYLDLVRANFAALGLPSSFRLADEGELAVLRTDVMNAVLSENFERDPDFGSFSENFVGTRRQKDLADIFLKIVSKLDSRPEGLIYLKDHAETLMCEAKQPYLSTRAGHWAKDHILLSLDAAIGFYEYALEKMYEDPALGDAYSPAFSADLDFARALYELVLRDEYDGARDLLAARSPMRLKAAPRGHGGELSKQLGGTRSEYSKKLDKLRERFFNLDEAETAELERMSANIVIRLYSLLLEYERKYSEEKLSRGICEFADNRKNVLKLLLSDGKPTEVAHAERERFDYIFVDEYQDTDAVQDLIFHTVSRGDNLFLVGDIKQSIYSFRNADPTIFAGLRRKYPPYTQAGDPTGPCSVFMSHNFRCDAGVIDFTNGLCSYLFAESEGSGHGIGYTESDDLICAKSGAGNAPVELTVISRPDPDADEGDEEGSVGDAEIDLVVNKIRELLREGKYGTGDIAVLARGKKINARICRALSRLGIPSADSDGESLFENPEVLLMNSLLSAIDNPQRDVPLAAVLRSPIFGFDLGELVKMRLGRGDCSLCDAIMGYISDGKDRSLAARAEGAMARLDSYRAEAEAMPIHRLIRSLWLETGALAYSGSDAESALRTPEERRANLLKFYEYARRFEASSYRGLHDFVEYIGSLIERGQVIKSEATPAPDAVRIMSIHKSKGLEFPVVFLVGAGARFNTADTKENIIYAGGGISLRISDADGLGQITPPMHRAAAQKLAYDTAEEEIRILYVALTRARERLYISAALGRRTFASLQSGAELRAYVGGRGVIASAGSYLDWIMTAHAAGRLDGCFEYSVISADEIPHPSADICTEPTYSEADVALAYEHFKDSFSRKYAFGHLSAIPAKLSVSRLLPDVLDREEDGENYDALLERARAMASRKPRFLLGDIMSDEADAASRGTATHLFLQFCRLDLLTDDPLSIDRECARLVAERFISQEVAALVRRDELFKFVRSRFFARLKGARMSRREQRFNIILPAENFTESPELSVKLQGEGLLVQGVMDLFFEDSEGRVVLCDYKTDRLSRAELADMELAGAKLTERHARQLGYYKSALTSILGREPDEICIYSLHFGEAIEIKV